MRWPADRISIQVLDDSTDADTRRLVEQVCVEVAPGGANARPPEQPPRVQGGRARSRTRQTDAEFLIIFDADFVPPEDFLLRAIPHSIGRTANLTPAWR